jgi:hypothetical protein
MVAGSVTVATGVVVPVAGVVGVRVVGVVAGVVGVTVVKGVVPVAVAVGVQGVVASGSTAAGDAADVTGVACVSQRGVVAR